MARGGGSGAALFAELVVVRQARAARLPATEADPRMLAHRTGLLTACGALIVI
jgi:hypothetical protein